MKAGATMSFRTTVTFSNSTTPGRCVLELEGEPDSEEMSIVKVISDSTGQFVDHLIEAAIKEDTIPRYTGGGRYTEALTSIIRVREAHNAEEAVSDEDEAKAAAAILELASDVVVSYFPAWSLDDATTLHFVLGHESSPHSVNNFWVPNITALETVPEASLAA